MNMWLAKLPRGPETLNCTLCIRTESRRLEVGEEQQKEQEAAVSGTGESVFHSNHRV